MKAVLLTLTTLLAAATLAGVLVGIWGGDSRWIDTASVTFLCTIIAGVALGIRMGLDGDI